MKKERWMLPVPVPSEIPYFSLVRLLMGPPTWWWWFPLCSDADGLCLWVVGCGGGVCCCSCWRACRPWRFCRLARLMRVVGGVRWERWDVIGGGWTLVGDLGWATDTALAMADWTCGENNKMWKLHELLYWNVNLCVSLLSRGQVQHVSTKTHLFFSVTIFYAIFTRSNVIQY